MDEARSRYGRLLDRAGLAPREASYRVVAELSAARLRAYQAVESSRSHATALLIIPAPFKRAYIWDLMPEVSVVRRWLERGVNVYLLEWTTPMPEDDAFGLAEYADEWPFSALRVIENETGCAAPLVAGHSLGGTLAAIFASLHPKSVGGLILVDAPLAFGGELGGPLGRALRAIAHASAIRALASPVPGSVINALCAAAAPEVFIGERLSDFTASLLDARAMAIHGRVERWTYDELPMPGALFEDVLEQLYRRDLFFKGTLQVGARQTGAALLRAPVLAVLNPVGRIVPPGSMLTALDTAPNLAVELLEYTGDRGAMFQHLGPLVTPLAHETLWPRILDWALSREAALAGD
jgi:polyhydroxyalkanoate synthase